MTSNKYVAIQRGAEAIIRRSIWQGRTVVEKERIVKRYRHPAIDSKLRAERIKAEARLLHEARKLGVSVPIIYDIDLWNNKLVIEFIDGKRIKEYINDPTVTVKRKRALCRVMGRIIGMLHEGGITHGDLTTSNMIIANGKVYFIDFSMGGKNADIERMGVDLHLLREAFSSAHSENFALFSSVIEGYLSVYPKGKEVIRKMREIEERGRYSRNVG